MYQIQFRLHGARPQTPLGSLQRSPDLIAGLRGHTSKGREGDGKREGTGRGGEPRGGEGTRTHPFTPP